MGETYDRNGWSELVHAIAKRDKTARQLAEDFAVSVEWLREFAETNLSAIKAERERIDNPPEDKAGDISPEQLDSLWITNKFERLKRLQEVAESVYDEIINSRRALNPAEYSTVVREFRSYLMLASNELGQLMHRGSGDAGQGDTLAVEINGVNMDALR